MWMNIKKTGEGGLGQGAFILFLLRGSRSK